MHNHPGPAARSLVPWLVASLSLMILAALSGCGDGGSGSAPPPSQVCSPDAGTSACADSGAGQPDTTGDDLDLPPEEDEDALVVTWTSFEDRPCPPDNRLDYDNFGAPFILNWCVGCHSTHLPEGERAGAPVGIDFNTLEDVHTWAPRIWARSADDNATMPPFGGPGFEERFYLGQWLACLEDG